MQTRKPDTQDTKSSSKMTGKHNFENIYNHTDPRPYYRALGPLDYRVAEYARPIVERCLRTLSRVRGKQRLTILDLCCGYGVNGSLLRHSVGMADLYKRYADPRLDDLDSEELAEDDRRFFAARKRNGHSANGLVGDILGLDPADNAVRYAEQTGLIDRGAAINLEREELPEELRNELSRVDLITVTGGMGYITDVTFRKLLAATPADARPWILSFPLRGLDLSRFERTFAEHGLEGEAWEDPIPQRRFADEAERERILDRLEQSGLDSGLERRNGRLFAFCHLARPEHEQVKLVEHALEEEAEVLA